MFTSFAMPRIGIPNFYLSPTLLVFFYIFPSLSRGLRRQRQRFPLIYQGLYALSSLEACPSVGVMQPPWCGVLFINTSAKSGRYVCARAYRYLPRTVVSSSEPLLLYPVSTPQPLLPNPPTPLSILTTIYAQNINFSLSHFPSHSFPTLDIFVAFCTSPLTGPITGR